MFSLIISKLFKHISTYVYKCTNMTNVRFDLVLDEKLGKKFRKIAQERGGYKRGALSIAFAQAIDIWINNRSHSKLTVKSKTQARRRSM